MSDFFRFAHYVTRSQINLRLAISVINCGEAALPHIDLPFSSYGKQLPYHC